MSPRDDEERERPSWREIDQRRDGSRHRAPAKAKVAKKEAEKVRKQALALAEALFKGKRARPEYQTALRQLESCHGTKKFPGCAKKFLEEYGLPEEWGALMRLLDYPEPAVVVEALQAMSAQAAAKTRVEQQGFKGKLQIIALTSGDAEVRRMAEEIRDQLQ
jgi:hypothetical protein